MTSAEGSEQFDAVAVGETMVAFVSHDDPQHFRAILAGAESNVAIGLAQLGCNSRWVSRLGDDPLGDFVVESITARNVDVAASRDATRPTGVMTKHITAGGTVGQYYRSESAARELSVDDLDRAEPARWIHVTGITAALSESAADLVTAIVEHRTGHDGRVSFDVNYRPALWPDASAAAGVFLPLARRADVVFVGDDEAGTLFGAGDARELAGLILRRADQELVLKRGSGPASVLTLDGEVSAPALPAVVVDPTGAGDAFAAGYLAGTIFGWPAEARLRLGHLMGSRVVGVLDDVPPPFTEAELEAHSPAALAARWSDRPA
jgi:2-dehydro-3-deoxygluconokinase